MAMARSQLARWAAAAALCVAASSADAASFHLQLSPTADGQTAMSFSASGYADIAGGGGSLFWANLLGGDPFDPALQTAYVDFEPIQTQSGIHLVGLTLDSDGNTAEGQDDFTLRFDGLVTMDDALFTAPTTRVLALDFDLLNPGSYGRVTDAGDLNLTILASAVPLPATAHLMLGGLVLLAGLRQYPTLKRRRPAA